MRSSGNFVMAIALERIYRLFELAEMEFAKNPERGRRYVEIARAIGTRNRATIPGELKKKFCRKCGAFWVAGKNLKIKNAEGSGSVLQEYVCGECGASRKFPAENNNKNNKNNE